MFYTIRGHAPAVYHEPDFRLLMLNGILWATHRLEKLPRSAALVVVSSARTGAEPIRPRRR